jgi:hypothetical protein
MYILYIYISYTGFQLGGIFLFDKGGKLLRKLIQRKVHEHMSNAEIIDTFKSAGIISPEEPRPATSQHSLTSTSERTRTLSNEGVSDSEDPNNRCSPQLNRSPSVDRRLLPSDVVAVEERQRSMSAPVASSAYTVSHNKFESLNLGPRMPSLSTQIPMRVTMPIYPPLALPKSVHEPLRFMPPGLPNISSASTPLNPAVTEDLSLPEVAVAAENLLGAINKDLLLPGDDGISLEAFGISGGKSVALS